MILIHALIKKMTDDRTLHPNYRCVAPRLASDLTPRARIQAALDAGYTVVSIDQGRRRTMKRRGPLTLIETD